MKGKDNRVLLSKIKYEIKYMKTSGPIAQVSKLKKQSNFAESLLQTHTCSYVYMSIYYVVKKDC